MSTRRKKRSSRSIAWWTQAWSAAQKRSIKLVVASDGCKPYALRGWCGLVYLDVQDFLVLVVPACEPADHLVALHEIRVSVGNEVDVRMHLCEHPTECKPGSRVSVSVGHHVRSFVLRRCSRHHNMVSPHGIFRRQALTRNRGGARTEKEGHRYYSTRPTPLDIGPACSSTGFLTAHDEYSHDKHHMYIPNDGIHRSPALHQIHALMAAPPSIHTPQAPPEAPFSTRALIQVTSTDQACARSHLPTSSPSITAGV